MTGERSEHGKIDQEAILAQKAAYLTSRIATAVEEGAGVDVTNLRKELAIVQMRMIETSTSPLSRGVLTLQAMHTLHDAGMYQEVITLGARQLSEQLQHRGQDAEVVAELRASVLQAEQALQPVEPTA